MPYTLEHAAQLGRAPSHFDLRFRQAIHAVLTHRRFWVAASAPLRDFLRVAPEVGADEPAVLELGSSMVLLNKRNLEMKPYASQVRDKRSGYEAGWRIATL